MSGRDGDGPSPWDDAETASSQGEGARRGGDAREAEGASREAGRLVARRYRIVGRLGRGGMGEVFRAKDLSLGTDVALKFLPTRYASDPVRMEQLRSEVRAARQVSHASVCRVYDIDEDGAQPFLIMEHIDGEDLRSLLRRIGRLPREKAAELARQIAAGVAAVHEQDLVHRDLKPANVMIDGRGRARVTDFGLTQSLADLQSRRGELAGTPSYMSPEQLRGDAVTPRSDIYSLGLVLYELFTGKPAYEARTEVELRRVHETSSLPTRPSDLLDDIDPAAERIIMQCLEPDPSERPSSALAVLAALPGGDPLAEMLRAGETPSPELVASTGKSGAISRRSAAALLGLIALGTVVLLWFFSHVPLDEMIGGMLPPAVLEHRSRELLAELGHTAHPEDSASGFGIDEEAVSRLVGKRPQRRRQLLRQRDRSVVEFWYRESGAPMSPWRSSLPGFDTGGIVTPEDPPLLEKGMALVRLDPRGRLIELRVVPPDGASARAEAGPDEATVSSILHAAEVDPKTIRELPLPRAPGRVGWSQRRWVARDRSDPGVERRIEATFHGPALVRVASGSTAPTSGDSGEGRRVVSGVGSLIFLSFFSGGAILALVNRRARRWDRRGGIRVAAFVFVVCLATGLIQSHHSFSLQQEARGLVSTVAYAAVRALMTWLLYVAMEPLIRRFNPTSLVSWSRLLAGRLRDPAVGRDVVIGLTVTVVQYLTMAAIVIPMGWAGSVLPSGVVFEDARPLDLWVSLADLLRSPVLAIGYGLGYLMVYTLLRAALGRVRFLAPILLGVLIAADRFVYMALQVNVSERVVCAVILGAGLAFAAERCGLLAFITCLATNTMVVYTIPTLDPSSWYFPQTVLFIVMIVGLAALGVRTAAGTARPVSVPREP